MDPFHRVLWCVSIDIVIDIEVIDIVDLLNMYIYNTIICVILTLY